MENDFTLIKHRLTNNENKVEIYCIADIHVGSQEFDEDLWKRFKNELLDKPNRYCIIAGDLFDCGLKNSKTNIYEQTMTVRQQLDWLLDELEEIKDRILGIVGGNHSSRITKEIGIYPIYDLCRILRIEDLYRANLALMKVNFGQRTKDRQYSFCIGMHHGGTRGKKQRFEYAIDGIDAFVSGHTHDGEITYPAKITIDKHNEAVTIKPFLSIVCTSFLKYGGYGLEAMYLPKGNDKFQVLTLNENTMELHWR